MCSSRRSRNNTCSSTNANDVIMRPVYNHNGESYIILDQKPLHHFMKSAEQQPDMEHVQMFMKWCQADHVLRNQTHFLFCETILEAEIID